MRSDTHFSFWYNVNKIHATFEIQNHVNYRFYVFDMVIILHLIFRSSMYGIILVAALLSLCFIISMISIKLTADKLMNMKQKIFYIQYKQLHLRSNYKTYFFLKRKPIVCILLNSRGCIRQQLSLQCLYQNDITYRPTSFFYQKQNDQFYFVAMVEQKKVLVFVVISVLNCCLKYKGFPISINISQTRRIFFSKHENAFFIS